MWKKKEAKNEEKKHITPGQATVLYIALAFSLYLFVAISPALLEIMGNIIDYAGNINPLLGFLTALCCILAYLFWLAVHMIMANILRRDYGAFGSEVDVK
ncbi:MAG: hypothetical protein JHC26_09645 [Thermofilum sp.]|uniref:hypothetical protein n=1 Tax=Thermofilum sp. TaxID=1961369 RepID=UPI002585D0DB|nr:hypothetical protein [Thermofilum sp.]MCI4409344.1 hypothetical protein [Thermofilum sp.]